MENKWEEIGCFDRLIRLFHLIFIPITIAIAGWFVSNGLEKGKIEAEKIKAASSYVTPLYDSVRILKDARIDLKNWASQHSNELNTKPNEKPLKYALRDGYSRFRYEELLSLCMQPKCEIVKSYIKARQDAENKVRALAGFGEVAIPFLISLLEDEEVEAREMATIGFELISNRNNGKDSVGKALVRILENRTHLYAWYSHESAILILGWIDYKDAIDVITKFEKRLGKEYWEKAFDSEYQYSKKKEERIRNSINRSLKYLKG